MQYQVTLTRKPIELMAHKKSGGEDKNYQVKEEKWTKKEGKHYQAFFIEETFNRNEKIYI